MREFKFQLPDRDGTTHSYTGLMHSGDDALELVPLMAECYAVAADSSASIGIRGRELTRIIVQRGTRELVYELLRHTSRDGQSLSDRGVFNQSYQGNQLELLAAVWKVVQENFGDFFDESALERLVECGIIDPEMLGSRSSTPQAK